VTRLRRSCLRSCSAATTPRFRRTLEERSVSPACKRDGEETRGGEAASARFVPNGHRVWPPEGVAIQGRQCEPQSSRNRNLLRDSA
jgi:hypothetical protein